MRTASTRFHSPHGRPELPECGNILQRFTCRLLPLRQYHITGRCPGLLPHVRALHHLYSPALPLVAFVIVWGLSDVFLLDAVGKAQQSAFLSTCVD